jgi:hypothetical protein
VWHARLLFWRRGSDAHAAGYDDPVRGEFLRAGPSDTATEALAYDDDGEGRGRPLFGVLAIGAVCRHGGKPAAEVAESALVRRVD